jgi:hypothetical protein
MKHGTAVLVTALGTVVGVAAVVAGGLDDSPGLQGLGVLVVLGAVAYGVRRARRSG